MNDDYKHPAPQYGEEKKDQYEYKPEKEPKPEKYDDKKEPKKPKKEKKPEKYDDEEKEKKPQGYQSGKDHDKRDPVADGPDDHPDDFDEQGNRRGGGWRNAGGRTTAPVIGGVLGLAVVMAALL